MGMSQWGIAVGRVDMVLSVTLSLILLVEVPLLLNNLQFMIKYGQKRVFLTQVIVKLLQSHLKES